MESKINKKMEKITKVKDINITKLNNAEYRTFMARYGNLLAGGGGDSESPDEISFDPNDPLGIPQELRTAFAADFALLTDAVNQSSASEETAQMSTLDKERDDLLIFSYFHHYPNDEKARWWHNARRPRSYTFP